MVESVNGPEGALHFNARVNALLAEGWDVLSASTLGLDTGGGIGGSAPIMMLVSLVKYEYFKLEFAPSPVPNAD